MKRIIAEKSLHHKCQWNDSKEREQSKTPKRKTRHTCAAEELVANTRTVAFGGRADADDLAPLAASAKVPPSSTNDGGGFG